MKHQRPIKITCTLAAASVGLAACMDAEKPDNPAEIAARWSTDSQAYRGPVSPDGWLKDLPSAQLGKLVDEALHRNHDLQAAAARMRAARARGVIAGADRLPQLRANQDASRTLSVGPDDLRQRANDFGLALNLSWEIDLWGRLRDAASAAEREATAAEFDYRAARLSLAGNTAKAWFNATEAELQVELARDTLTSFQNNLDIIDRAFGARGR